MKKISIFIVTILIVGVGITGVFFGKTKIDDGHYATFFTQIDKNIWPDYLESNRLYIETARIDQLEFEEAEKQKFQWNEKARERLERITRAKGYVYALPTFDNTELITLKDHLVKSMEYLEPSAEGDLLRIKILVCFLTNKSLTECKTDKLSEEMIHSHTAKFNLAVEEFNKFLEEAEFSKKKIAGKYIKKWSEEKNNMLQELNK